MRKIDEKRCNVRDLMYFKIILAIANMASFLTLRRMKYPAERQR